MSPHFSKLMICVLAGVCLFSAFEARAAAPFVTVDGQRFIDGEGRHLLLHGINIVSKNRRDNYQPHISEEDFAMLRSWGWNCIRLGVIWDGLEPEMGVFDEAYLEKLDGWIALAKKHGFYVFLDMHQDLFSYKYSDGAPEWATLDDGLPHQRGAIWSDAYLISPAVHQAFDSFWENRLCADGIGVQDHFAAAWKKLAERYKDEEAVIGYDLFNEPNIGSENTTLVLEVLNAYVSNANKLPAGEELISLQDVLESDNGHKLRSTITRQMGNMEFYKALLDAATPLCTEFERSQVTRMFQRVRDAIRSVDQKHIILLETNISANLGVPTGIEPLVDEEGKRDPLQAFAPHAYDIVVDTHELELANTDRLDLIFQRHAESSERLDMPVVVGEWGAFGAGTPGVLPSARLNVNLLEKHLMSDTYWDYSHRLEHSPCMEIFQRPIALHTNGRLLSCFTDFTANSFTCRWEENPAITAPTVIYLPERMAVFVDKIRLEPAGAAYVVTTPYENSNAVVVEIPPLGSQTERSFFLADD